jgi:cyclopropane fatty-acyl-phospholipid synthase-like methyltransferase
MTPQLERERAYYDQLYSGFAQQHFSRPAVTAFRRDLARRIVACTGITRSARVLSLGCGIGDTELLLAPQAGEIVGVDLSPKAVEYARDQARREGVSNVRFLAGEWQSVLDRVEPFDAVLGIFFLHHLPEAEWGAIPGQLRGALRTGGVFYALEPSHARLSEKIGKLLFPALMRRYQTEDERALDGRRVAAAFRDAGFDASSGWFDFGSLPVAGLCPGSAGLYRAARLVDEALIRVPGLNRWSNAFELVARMAVSGRIPKRSLREIHLE